MKREGTVGVPAILAARLRITSRAPRSCAKSWAERPMRRSGRSSPSASRIGRLSQASVLLSGGQVPSTRPPSTTRSLSVRRASSSPRMRTRKSGPRRPAHDAARQARRKTVRHSRMSRREAARRPCSSRVRRAPRRVLCRRHRRRRSRHPSCRDSAANTSRWRAASSPSGMRPLPRLSSGASACAKAGDKICGGGKLGLGQIRARIGRMQIGFCFCAVP